MQLACWVVRHHHHHARAHAVTQRPPRASPAACSLVFFARWKAIVTHEQFLQSIAVVQEQFHSDNSKSLDRETEYKVQKRSAPAPRPLLTPATPFSQPRCPDPDDQELREAQQAGAGVANAEGTVD